MPSKRGESEADQLYGLPLAEFTHGRDELAKRLRKEGHAEEAAAVKALRKPTAPAWALNQIARRRPKDIKRLLATGKRLREAHEALIGGGDRSALQKASAEEREAIDELTRDAMTLANEAGSAASAALDERIRNTLHAAALDEETAAELEAGRLVHDREAVGMGGVPTAAPRAAPKAKPAADKRGDDRAAEQRRQVEQDLAAAREEEQAAQREHASATKAAERAARDADEAQRRAEQTRAELREVQRREKDAAKAADRAARAVTAAEKKLG